jgi:hypothetical protein
LGWVDYLDNEYISLFCLVKKSGENELNEKQKLFFTKSNLEDIYKDAVKILK